MNDFDPKLTLQDHINILTGIQDHIIDILSRIQSIREQNKRLTNTWSNIINSRVSHSLKRLINIQNRLNNAQKNIQNKLSNVQKDLNNQEILQSKKKIVLIRRKTGLTVDFIPFVESPLSKLRLQLAFACLAHNSDSKYYI
jgi:predicted  nucleic acid-binding Zn-ribbon protein